jgi:hypothetical protein
VIEDRSTPGIGVMAGRALPGKMVGRSPVGMAGLAIGRPCSTMVEGSASPGIGIVAQRALPGVVVSRSPVGMAGLAVRRAGYSMVEAAAFAVMWWRRHREHSPGVVWLLAVTPGSTGSPLLRVAQRAPDREVVMAQSIARSGWPGGARRPDWQSRGAFCGRRLEGCDFVQEVVVWHCGAAREMVGR